MSESVLSALEYFGAGASLLAALIVSLNLGTRVTGWAFVLFVASSVALIGWGFLSGDSEAIAWQNIGLLLINIVGVYRYLLAGEKPDPDGDTA